MTRIKRNQLRVNLESLPHTVLVARYRNPIAFTYNRVTALTGGPLVNQNLEEYITRKGLYGLFYLIAREENKIMENPTARVNEILRKVFCTKV